jgi:hypothetical protein
VAFSSPAPTKKASRNKMRTISSIFGYTV